MFSCLDSMQVRLYHVILLFPKNQLVWNCLEKFMARLGFHEQSDRYNFLLKTKIHLFIPKEDSLDEVCKTWKVQM